MKKSSENYCKLKITGLKSHQHPDSILERVSVCFNVSHQSIWLCHYSFAHLDKKILARSELLEFSQMAQSS